MTGTAFAHTASAATRGAAEPLGWGSWHFDTVSVLPLLLVGVLYAVGVRGAWRRAGIGRAVSVRQVLCFSAGWAACVLALVSPIDAYGERLFSAHMLQHLLLMNFAAPLLVLGAPLSVWVRPLPRALQRGLAGWIKARAWRRAWHGLRSAAVATALQQAVLWSWHTPAGIEAALGSEALHMAMHTSLLAVALLFWTAVLGADARRCWQSIAALATTLKVSGLVCIAMMLQDSAFYTAYGSSAAQWGWSAAEDEQIGWGLMMTLGSLTPVGFALALLVGRAGPLNPAAERLIPSATRLCRAPPPGTRSRPGGLRSTVRDRRAV